MRRWSSPPRLRRWWRLWKATTRWAAADGRVWLACSPLAATGAAAAALLPSPLVASRLLAAANSVWGHGARAQVLASTLPACRGATSCWKRMETCACGRCRSAAAGPARWVLPQLACTAGLRLEHAADCMLHSSTLDSEHSIVQLCCTTHHAPPCCAAQGHSVPLKNPLHDPIKAPEQAPVAVHATSLEK